MPGINTFWRRLRARSDERGSVALQTAIVLAVVLGMASLGVEVTLILLKHRQMQAAADAAAMAGASGLAVSPAVMVTEAQAIASAHGFVPGAGGTTLTVNTPPASGAQAGLASAVEVILAQPQHPQLARLFRAEAFDVRARAVAMRSVAGACVVILDTSGSGAVTLSNNATVTNTSCALAVNSSSSSALILRNNATLTGPAALHGGYQLSNGASLNTGSVVTYGDVTSDPYAGLTLPTPSGVCRSGTRNGSATLTAGHYCSGWVFGNNARITLSPGVYFVDQRMNIGNGVTLTGTGGVTIIINGDYAISVGNNLGLTLTAPTTGATAGFAMISPASNSAFLTQRISNNASINVRGVLYFPSQAVVLSNNGLSGESDCTQLVARRVTFENNIAFRNSCDGVGLTSAGASGVKLIE